ncbi:Copper amine oxidase N-terminal domain-containing protein [Paenibacillus sophorae]|uniref:Copper amine oxidase N-terminal domain-containing protein n=1 Tax=Paenibacillus sophorae TaxID=1333845 RepID=A0A1H8VYJ4_9BACL|nr:copper amine oxidase N-terminal domain-containing protein [Paenibacillus sophorae]QWU16388.1 copper amine oxidase N-terminal domain-containing protein [Paenibacillus sophorae]SEP20410.1 Copper amine oxidase N-terminal domain-containing protein [Paenibacillus sophorae]
MNTRSKAFRRTAALLAASTLTTLLFAAAPFEAAFASSASTPPAVPSAAESAVLNDLTLEHPGFQENGTTYVPLKDISTFLDLQLLWNSGKSSLEVTGLYQAVSLKAGQPKAYTAAGKVIMLGAETLIRGGVTYVPDKLFSKAFGVPVVWKGDNRFAVPYAARYIKTSTGRELFWLNREQGVLYTGQSGRVPLRAGIIRVADLDWVSMSARRINSASYAVEIENASGEPHINNTRWRALVSDGSLVDQAKTHYRNPRMIGMKRDIFAFQGNVVMVDGQTLTLVNPDGHIFKTYDLLEITGINDAFAVEAVDTDFLLVRPFQKGTLILIDRRSGQSVQLYKQLLSADDQAWLEAYPDTEIDYPGDNLEYTGRSGDTLSFEWTSFTGGQKVHFTYTLSPLS